jgi:LacI family transcriptional regulator
VNPWFYTADYARGFYEAAQCLLAQGHRRLAILGGRKNYEPTIERRRGYCQALEEAGFSPVPEMNLYNDELSGLVEMLERQRPTAVLAEDVQPLMALLFAARDLKISIPRDLSVIGNTYDLDVHTLYQLTGLHELTRLEVPCRELGIAGMELLFRLIKGEEPPRENRLPLLFTPGESCGPPGA